MFDVGGKGVGGEGGTYAVGATIGRLCHHITGVVNDKDVVASGTGVALTFFSTSVWFPLALEWWGERFGGARA